MRALLRDLRLFAFSGNLIDLAVGVAIGAAFKTVVASAVTATSARDAGMTR